MNTLEEQKGINLVNDDKNGTEGGSAIAPTAEPNGCGDTFAEIAD